MVRTSGKREKRTKRHSDADEMFIEAPSRGNAANLSNTKKFATSAKVLHMNELQVVFHLPMAEAAIKLGVCSTVLKKICRRNGISRWPYRQIRKIDKAIEELDQSHSSKADDRITMDIMSRSNALKHLRLQIIDNPEIDRSNELGAALNDKLIGGSFDDNQSNGGEYGDMGGGLGGVGVVLGGSLGGSILEPSSTSSLIMDHHHQSHTPGSGVNSVIGNGGGVGLDGGLNCGGVSYNGGLNGMLATGPSQPLGGGRVGESSQPDVFPIAAPETYHPANLKTVFPRDIIEDGAGSDGYGFGGGLGLIDVSWSDNADPCTGMMLYRGEHYEWLASHAAVVRGGGGGGTGCGSVSGGAGGGGSVSALRPDVMDGGPINETTRQQNRISVDSGLCPILPAIDITDVTLLAKPCLVFAIDSDAFGPFDTDECRAGITIW